MHFNIMSTAHGTDTGLPFDTVSALLRACDMLQRSRAQEENARHIQSISFDCRDHGDTVKVIIHRIHWYILVLEEVDSDGKPKEIRKTEITTPFVILSKQANLEEVSQLLYTEILTGFEKRIVENVS